MKKSLTERQKEILAYVRSYARKRNNWPSFRDIQAHFGFRSLNAVMGHLRALERKGAITRMPSQARTFRLRNDSSHCFAGADADDSPGVSIPSPTEEAADASEQPLDDATQGLSPGSFTIRMPDDSMVRAGIKAGDSVVLEPMPPRDGDIVAVAIGETISLMRFTQAEEGRPILGSEPGGDAPSPIVPADTEILGVASTLIRELRPRR